MHFLELTLPTVAENLALDEALLLNAEAGGPDVLRIWEWPTPAVVLGAACRLADDVNEPACLVDGVPIFRRASGGGTVLLDAGCLLFSLVLGYDSADGLHDIRMSYCIILEMLRLAFFDAADAQPAGISDLALGDRKISGNAQQRKRDHFLHHGTILYSFEAAHVGRFLGHPARQPEYRNGRQHKDFLVNLPLTRMEIVRRLRDTWRAETQLTTPPLDLARRLVEEKYSQEEWTRRR